MSGEFIVLVHGNPVAIDNGSLKVDRKFHNGMLSYARQMKLPCFTLNPTIRSGERIMDPVETPLRDLPYQVQAVDTDYRGRPTGVGIETMRKAIDRAALVYGSGMGSYEIALESRRPFISLRECDLKTQLAITTSGIGNPARKLARTARCIWNYKSRVIKELKGASGVHCNGYPMYDVASRYNPNTLLYLDSRMTNEAVISSHELESRLASRAGRKLRLLYSGRYEALKGAEDVVKVGMECLRRGMQIELHCYGQGTLKNNMMQLSLTSVSPEQIVINDAVPYPELTEIAKTFDLFVCCHIQNDPSCTYLESMGAGLPVVGYANRMWERMHAVSNAGVCSPMRAPNRVVDSIQRLMSDQNALSAMSRQAASFARQHNFEVEFRKRIDAVNASI